MYLIIDEDRRVNASTFNEQFYSTKAFSENSGIKEITKPNFTTKKENIPVINASESRRGLDEDVKDSEDAGQFHYRKTNGERPGQKYGDTFGSAAIGKVLGISKSAGMNLLERKKIDYIEVNGYRRIFRSSFMDWYNSQDHYKMKMSVDEAEGYES